MENALLSSCFVKNEKIQNEKWNYNTYPLIERIRISEIGIMVLLLCKYAIV